MNQPEWLQTTLDLVGTNAYARAGAILLVAMVLAKLVDWFLTGALRAWAKERLAPYKVPTRLLCLPELPRNALGKVTKPDVVAFF